MGPCTASSCCCQARNLSWAPVPPPHAAARSRVCHGSLYGLPLLPRNLPWAPSVPAHSSCLPGFHNLSWAPVPPPHGCLVQSVSWAPVPTPHAAARPVICHGGLLCHRTASSCCCQVQSVSWVPVRPPIAAV
ncbi:unnamed protein product, partial [Staurois parvus]